MSATDRTRDVACRRRRSCCAWGEPMTFVGTVLAGFGSVLLYLSGAFWAITHLGLIGGWAAVGAVSVAVGAAIHVIPLRCPCCDGTGKRNRPPWDGGAA